MSFFFFFTEPVAGKNQITKTESISEDLYIIYKKYKFLFYWSNNGWTIVNIFNIGKDKRFFTLSLRSFGYILYNESDGKKIKK